MTAIDIPFTKMNGLGNDFVMIDARARAMQMPPALAAAIADRTTGIGCDSIIMLENSENADVFMRVINADGTESGACGNATRCVPLLMGDEFGRNDMFIETGGGVLFARRVSDANVSVDIGAPRLDWEQIPLSHEVADTRSIPLTHTLPDCRVLQNPSVVNVGNPHCIFWVADADSYDLAAFGPALEHHGMFPERANISLAEVVSQNAIKLRVWERGVGITQACGTAACAAAVAGVRSGKTAREVNVALPGGTLHIEWRAKDDHVIMTGPAAFEYDGILRIDAQDRLVSHEERQVA